MGSDIRLLPANLIPHQQQLSLFTRCMQIALKLDLLLNPSVMTTQIVLSKKIKLYCLEVL